MPFPILILLMQLLFQLPTISIHSQNADSLKFKQLLALADSMYNTKDYEAAVGAYLKSYTWAESKQLESYYSATRNLYALGNCYYSLKQYSPAHEFYFKALKSARLNNRTTLQQQILQMLHSVHYNIQAFDKTFQYPTVSNFIIQPILFTIDSVFSIESDTAVVRVAGGLYDGIDSSRKKAETFQTYQQSKDGFFEHIGPATLMNAGNNISFWKVKIKQGYSIQKGGQIRISVKVPEKLATSSIFELYSWNINWRNNEKYLNLFNRRFLYHFYDEAYIDNMLNLLNADVQTKIENVAADTLNPESEFHIKVQDGIFKGQNMFLALSKSTETSILQFLHYVSNNGFTYAGLSEEFSQYYATWVYNGAPLNQEDAKKYLLENEEDASLIKQRAILIFGQASKNNWPEQWLDKALEASDKNYLDEILSYSRLLYNYGIANQQMQYAAWANVLDALRLKGLGYMGDCKQYLDEGQAKFEKINYQEGIQWINSARQTLLDTNTISVTVQTGHLMEFSIYPSPNPRYFATFSDDYTIKIWDAFLGKEIKTILGHTDEITSMSYNQGGRFLATLSRDNTIKIWNTYNYELMNTIKLADRHLRIMFAAGSNQLIVSGYDTTIKYIEPFSGKELKRFRPPGGLVRSMDYLNASPNILLLTTTDSAVYEYNIETATYKQVIKENKRIISFSFSPDGEYYYYTKSDSSIQFYKTQTGKYVYSDTLYSWKSTSSTYIAAGSYSPDSRYYVYCDKDGHMIVLNLAEGKANWYVSDPAKQYAFSSNGRFLIKSEAGEAPIIVDFTEFEWNNFEKKISTQELKTYLNPVLYAYFNKDGSKIRYSANYLNELDLGTAQTTIFYPGANYKTVHSTPFIDDSTLIIHSYKKFDTIFLYRLHEKKIINNFWLPGNENISAFTFIEQDSLLILGGIKGSIACWDMPSRKILYHKKNAAGHDDEILSMLYLKNSNQIAIRPIKKAPYVFDIVKGNYNGTFVTNSLGRFISYQNKLLMLSDSGQIDEFDVNTRKRIRILKPTKSTVQYLDLKLSADNKTLYILDEPNLHVVDLASGNLKYSMPIEGKLLSTISISPDESMLAICSFNSSILLYQLQTGKLLAKLYMPLSADAIVMDSVGHYMASRQSLQAVVFNYGGRNFNYDQFDLQLNQPHKILSAIGKANPTSIHAYEQAWLKRLKRAGLSEATINATSLPSMVVHNRTDLQAATTSLFYDITVECFDFKVGVANLYILVNDVPLSDSNGSWSKLDTSSIVKSIRIPLSQGDNNIKIYCSNKSGATSLKEVFNVKCLATNQKQRTWFVGMGVANYADSSMNLTYSAKDIRDLAATFKKIYPDIIIDTLLNEQVTIPNIKTLRKKLQSAGIQDRIIMAVTGHGLLSDSLDFYYATYDIDFKNPSKNGLRYDDLESLLSETQSRQKLLLIDACHSGLLDKESLMATTGSGFDRNNNMSETVRNTRSSIKIKPTQINASATFNLMQDLFADFSGNNGIAVISAAGGLEYAFESSSWNNGVFTYCVINALDEKTADKEQNGGNADRKISVQELSRYVSNQVLKLTQGKQKPASRRENLDNDWIIAQ